ncbi:cell division protein FtsA [Candidatus Parcubacteria bacterium]|nr:MAG: cell division protein FtsA [Candidatus Parcubacteria bacterium]
MRDEIIAGLDIGSTAVRLVVGQRIKDEGGEHLQIIGAVSAPSQGINRGAVSSIEDVTSSISACLEKAERLVGVPINSVWAGINSPHIKCQRSQGVVAVSKGDNEISREDVKRAIDAAQTFSVPPNYEILHVIPIKYKVDNQEDIKDPVGMVGVRLEVDTLVIQALSSQVNNLTKAIYRSQLEIDDLVISPLAAAEAVIGPKQKELGAVLVNIGSATTSIAVFEEGEVLHAAVLPIGSEHITADLAIGLRCPISLAEKIKLEYGAADASKFNKSDQVDVSSLAEEEKGEEGRTVSRKYIAEIIEARVEEIFNKVDKELEKIERSGMLPGGVFLVGGGTKLKDIVEVAKRQLRLPACIGTNQNISGAVIDKINDPAYLTALGLVGWGNHYLDVDSGFNLKASGENLLRKIKEFISRFAP